MAWFNSLLNPAPKPRLPAPTENLPPLFLAVHHDSLQSITTETLNFYLGRNLVNAKPRYHLTVLDGPEPPDPQQILEGMQDIADQISIATCRQEQETETELIFDDRSFVTLTDTVVGDLRLEVERHEDDNIPNIMAAAFPATLSAAQFPSSILAAPSTSALAPPLPMPTLPEISTNLTSHAPGIITIIPEGPFSHIYVRQFDQCTGYVWAPSSINLPFNFMTIRLITGNLHFPWISVVKPMMPIHKGQFILLISDIEGLCAYGAIKELLSVTDTWAVWRVRRMRVVDDLRSDWGEEPASPDPDSTYGSGCITMVVPRHWCVGEGRERHRLTREGAEAKDRLKPYDPLDLFHCVYEASTYATSYSGHCDPAVFDHMHKACQIKKIAIEAGTSRMDVDVKEWLRNEPPRAEFHPTIGDPYA